MNDDFLDDPPPDEDSACLGADYPHPALVATVAIMVGALLGLIAGFYAAAWISP